MHWPSRCVRCYACVSSCPLGAIAKNDAGAVVIERKTCDLCGKCSEACLYDAMQIIGRAMTVEDIVAEVERDRIFYEQSGGGVTISGGDPLAQPGFLEALLDAFRGRGIHAAVDTSGSAPMEILERIAARTDLILYDLKVMDDDQHRKFTGISNIPVLDNLRKLAAGKTDVWVRIPLVPGVNDDEENVRRTVEFLRSLKRIKKIGLLPYHSGGMEKAHRIGKRSRFRKYETLSAERISSIEEEFRRAGFDVKKGG